MLEAAQEQEYRVTFRHPRTGDTWPVDVSADVTAAQALDGLKKHGFLSALGGASMVLSNERTGETIPLTSTFASAGVQPGDHLAVIEVHEGGAPDDVRPCLR